MNIKPTKYFRIKLAAYYDNEFLRGVGKGSHTTARNEVTKVLHLAKTYFHGWNLGSTIDLAVVKRGHVSENLALKGRQDKL